MSKLSEQVPRIKQKVVCGFDKVRLALSHKMTTEDKSSLLHFLKQHTDYAEIERNEWPRDFEWVLMLVNPDEAARQRIAVQPGLTPRYAEPAAEWIVPDLKSALMLHTLFDNQFVEGWHSKRECWHYGDTIYTGEGTGKENAGHLFSGYDDKGSKFTGNPFCFRWEGRYQGIAALRRIGLGEAAGFFKFDHVAYWEKNLRLFWVDLVRLGRCHDNKQTGQRRHQARWWRRNGFAYNEDRALGCILFRRYGRHSDGQFINVQRFADRYGRGPFLHELDVSSLRPKAHAHIPDDCKQPTHSSHSPIPNRNSPISNAVSA